MVKKVTNYFQRILDKLLQKRLAESVTDLIEGSKWCDKICIA